MNNNKSSIVNGTYASKKRAWLITKEYEKHTCNSPEFISIFDFRTSSNTIKKFLEQLHFNNLAIYEQFSRLNCRRNFQPIIKHSTVKTSNEMQIKSSLPEYLPVDESIWLVGDLFIWARIVYDLKTWIDAETNIEYLLWKDKINYELDESNIEWKECSLELHRYL